jgi:hypothetical protein
MRGRESVPLLSNASPLSLSNPLERTGRLLTLVALLGAAACQDLTVPNTNEADSERVLAQSEDVGSLIGAAYNTWFQGVYYAYTWSEGTPGFFLSNQSFQHASPWANFAMEVYARLPRIGTVNDQTWYHYRNNTRVWHYSYRALSSVSRGLRALQDPEVADQLTPEELSLYRTFGKFIQGLGHGTLALLYARGFILDENTDLSLPQSPVSYAELMEASHGYFEEAIAMAEAGSFTVPFDWIPSQLSAPELARLAHSYRARLRAQLARTPEERAAVDWGRVLADVDAGIQETQTLYVRWEAGWDHFFLYIVDLDGWSQLPYFVYGMADQGGDVAEWYALPTVTEDEAGTSPVKQHRLPDGRPVLIVTPDLRFPQGSTVEEQRAQPGRNLRIVREDEEGLVWKRPDRGEWRWSWYKMTEGRGITYEPGEDLYKPEITLEEMRLLKAEGLYHMGDRAGAAAIVNETRTGAGLNSTDAGGTNTDCVPRLPDGSCGSLWEMLKWEKRLETMWTGVAGVNWFFDGRGWGDLYRGTPLHLPLPCDEAQVLLLMPCLDFGGPAGEWGSPGSTYNYPYEG